MIGQALQQLALPNPIPFLPYGQAALDYLETTTDRPLLILPRQRTGRHQPAIYEWGRASPADQRY